MNDDRDLTLCPIPGFTGYLARSDGAVMRKDRPTLTKSQCVRDGIAPTVRLRNDGGDVVSVAVHVLIATAFHGLRPARARCKHLDGDITNNREGNLAWRAPRSKRQQNSDRKAKKRALRAGVPFEPVDVLAVLGRDGWRCQICGIATPRRLRGTIRPNAPELDHRTPIKLGGGHTYENCQCACRSCNAAKAARSPRGQINLFPRPSPSFKRKRRTKLATTIRQSSGFAGPP